MADTDTRAGTLRAGTPFRVAGISFLPIEHILIHSDSGPAGAWFSIAKQPYALIVRDADGIRTVDVGAAISLQQLRENIPGLDALLAAM